MYKYFLRFAVFFILILFWIQTSIAQIRDEAGILLLNNRTGEQRFIPQGKKISVTDSLGNRFKGKFWLESENEIILDGQKIRTTQILNIKRRITGTKIVGVGLVTLGLAVFQLEVIATGVGNAVSQTSSEPEISPTGLWIAAASVPFFAYKPTFKSKRWIIKLIPKEKIDLP